MTRSELIAKHLGEYTRIAKPKHLSGSMFGNSMLQNFLIIKHSLDDGEFSVGQNTIGSIFHKGMEKGAEELFDNPDEATVIDMEVAVKRVLPNGWTITGTIDRIDYDLKQIVDYKLTKLYVKATLKKEPRHGYKMQLNAYKWAAELPDFKMYLDLFFKDQNMLKNDVAFSQVEIVDIEAFQFEAVEFTNELEGYLERDETPPECADKWFRKLPGKGALSTNTRCAFYCSAKDVCPFYSGYNKQKDEISELTRW